MELLEALAEVAGVGGEHDLAPRELQLQGLVAGGVAEGGEAHHAAVAEEVEFAFDLAHEVAVPVVVGVVAVRLDGLGKATRFPLPALDDDAGIGHQLVSARVVEVEMGVDDVVDPLRIDVELLQARPDVLTGAEVHLEEVRELPDASVGVVHGLRVQAGVEEHPALGVLDEVGGNGEADRAFASREHHAEIGAQPPAGHGVEAQSRGLAGSPPPGPARAAGHRLPPRLVGASRPG